ncbi:CSMD1, partial [Symbiodinium natans]
ALCEAASWVTTEYFVFTDTYHIVSGPSYVLVDEGGFPVLPYIHRDSSYCQERV